MQVSRCAAPFGLKILRRVARGSSQVGILTWNTLMLTPQNCSALETMPRHKDEQASKRGREYNSPQKHVECLP